MHRRINRRLEWESDSTRIFIVSPTVLLPHKLRRYEWGHISLNIIAGILTGGNPMQKNSENFSIQDAMRLASTPAGQELLSLLRRSDSAQLQQAAQLASAGNYTQAQQLLSGFLRDPEVQQLLYQLGGK
jgi:hypothetical protein